MYKSYETYLQSLRDRGKYRKLNKSGQERNSSFIDFSTNDYLNFNNEKNLIKAGFEAAKTFGVGATGSRLLSGNYSLCQTFEREIAHSKGTESALIFNSGFQANLSVLSCLLDDKILGQKPLVFFDRLNHASLYQALFLTKAQICRYQHNDLNHLEHLLRQYETDLRPKFLVSETIFGMDGDFASLEGLVMLARKFNLFLYLDEAHATGVFGKNGYGLSTLLDLKDIPHLIMGTFSKALSSSGAYIASDTLICTFIMNKAQGFIYSTAPSPFSVGAAFYAWKLLPNLDQRRVYLQNLAKDLRQKLVNLNFNIQSSQTHIIPIILREENLCLKIQQELYDKNILVSSIRPPTVPPHSSRLRIALTAQHTAEDVEKFVEILDNTVTPKHRNT